MCSAGGRFSFLLCFGPAKRRARLRVEMRQRRSKGRHANLRGRKEDEREEGAFVLVNQTKACVLHRGCLIQHSGGDPFLSGVSRAPLNRLLLLPLVPEETLDSRRKVIALLKRRDEVGGRKELHIHLLQSLFFPYPLLAPCPPPLSALSLLSSCPRRGDDRV